MTTFFNSKISCVQHAFQKRRFTGRVDSIASLRLPDFPEWKAVVGRMIFQGIFIEIFKFLIANFMFPMNTILVALAYLLSAISGNMANDRILFDGVSLDNWQVIEYEGHGEVSVADSCIIIGKGELISGIRWAGDFPKSGYEVTLSAKRVSGNDFFCGLTFPVRDSYLTLVLGGWRGALSGLSCIDGYDAANNHTGIVYGFGTGWWYDVRLKVTGEKVEAWVADEKLIDFTIGISRLSLRPEVESSVPFGITTYQTTGAVRNIRLKMISE